MSSSVSLTSPESFSSELEEPQFTLPALSELVGKDGKGRRPLRAPQNRTFGGQTSYPPPAASFLLAAKAKGRQAHDVPVTRGSGTSLVSGENAALEGWWGVPRRARTPLVTPSAAV